MTDHRKTKWKNHTNSILDVVNLTKQFPGTLALDAVTFSVKAGDIHALCGENGAGKSTLIKCLSGFWSKATYDGDFYIDGEIACFSQIAESEIAGISVIYQELALVQEMTVAENIYLGKEPRSFGLIDWNRLYRDTHNLLEKFGIELDPTARIRDLGIGQQQLVEIVKALADSPKILLLDEPTAALTETEVTILLAILNDLREKGITCIYISHKLDEIFSIADRITVLRDGKSVATLTTGKTDKDTVLRHMIGREIVDFYPRKSTPAGNILFSVEDLSIGESLSKKKILEGISFNVRAGEVLGIGGLMGAGRTELLMHLFAGWGERLRGTVNVGHCELKGNNPRQSMNKGIMLVTEDRKRFGLILEQSVGYNLSLASLEEFTIGHCLINRHSEFLKNREYFNSLKIRARDQESQVNTLSGGNQQKVVLGKALMIQPSVVLLDEPTRGIDVGAKLELYTIINQLTQEGKGVILVSSELPELMGMSDRLLILSYGKPGGEFTRSEFEQETLLKAAMAHA